METMASQERTEDGDGGATFTEDIDDIRDLLVDPEKDPFSSRPPYFMGQSVMTRIISLLKPRKGWDRLQYRLILRMPKETISPGLADAAKEAVTRYCQTMISDNLNQMEIIRRIGVRQLPYAFMFVIIFVSLGTILGSDVGKAISPFFTALSEGLFIIAWVALWGPVNTLLYDRFPLRRENRVYKVLENMEIEIRPR
jgi:hypothetical protein